MEKQLGYNCFPIAFLLLFYPWSGDLATLLEFMVG